MKTQILQNLTQLQQEATDTISKAANTADLENLRVEFAGKKGKLTHILKQLGQVSAEDRAELGQKANELKATIENLLTQQLDSIKKSYYENLSINEWYDVTVIPKTFPMDCDLGISHGHLHPISQMQKRLEQIFTSMGFSIMDGPQVETDYFNFGALNFSEDHPAREMQDTFYTKDGTLLRTHTSSVQVRGMQLLKPPIRMIAPGRVFRYEEVDASHENTFYQMEGMIIEKEISIAHLLYLMKTLLTEIFEKEVDVRLRPGYFPFVEPGFELDMKCLLCMGKGCSVCKHSGFVEVLPCGLIHPNVLESGKLHSKEWQGAAFGLGLDRLVMMKYGIEDIRYFHNPDPQFLTQF